MIWKEPPEHLNEVEKAIWKQKALDLLKLLMTLIYIFLFLCCGLLFYGLFGEKLFPNQQSIVPGTKYETAQRKKNRIDQSSLDRVENGTHLETGLIFADGFEEVRATCTACHSAKLVTQNRATREGWKSMIRWMQETQGLWELGRTEPIILDYLAKHYAPKKTNRRENIDVAAIEWYILELE